jgi:SAM-dependent methyltransferase
MLTKDTTNAEMWDRIYAGGHRIWYPSEALVRIVRRHERLDGFSGTILDHGCGSGAGAEFLIRSGHRVVCSDISAAALSAVAQRFVEVRLSPPDLVAFDPERPLKPQLPHFDHVIAWLSLYYNTKQGLIRQTAELIECLPRNGVFVMSVATMDDVVARSSEPLPDGTRKLSGDISGQDGALLAIPQDREELLSWCEGIEVRDVVSYGITFGGQRNDYWAVYGVKT